VLSFFTLLSIPFSINYVPVPRPIKPKKTPKKYSKNNEHFPPPYFPLW